MAYIPVFRRETTSELSADVGVPEELKKTISVPKTVIPMKLTTGNDLSESEVRLFEKLNNNSSRRENVRQFIHWENHYHEELVKMYNYCVNPKLNINYSKFAQMAYNCSEKEFLAKDHKNSRPLI